MALTLILWMIVLGINVEGANSQGCDSEAIIRGPLTSEGLALRVYILYTNETHPAVVRCQVTCLNHLSLYNPVMGLIITSEEHERIIFPGRISSRDGLYEISVYLISTCEAHNYTMEFEYFIYSNNSNIDGAILRCGVVIYYPDSHSSVPCLGQTLGIIRYNINDTLPTTKSQTTITDMIMRSSLAPTFECVNGTRLDNDTGNCTDIDECLEDLHDCSQHAVCIDVDGSYTCECVFGYEGNGVNCTLSRSVIIGTGVAGSLLVGAILLLLTIAGCIKILQKIQSKKKQDHKMDMVTSGTREKENPISGSDSISATKTVALRGSLKEKLTLSFIIKSTNLKILNPIGQGESGIVYKGYIVHKYTDELVAIKTLKGFIDENTIEELLRECDKMKNFHHQHVMTLKGVCLDGGPAPYLILPYMANGSLLSYIKKERSTLVVMDEADTDSNENPSKVYFTRKRLLDMCLQVAKGMEYLASEKVVHRDLAARNCMIDMNMVIKVADFGLAVNTGDKDYYRLTTNMGVKLPVMWMAPESLSNRVFSEMSDVWSYGVTCWEIFTGGQSPYAGTKPSSLLSLLQEGERLETPTNSACSSDMYSMMLWCWEMEPGKRPSFSALVQTLSKTLEEMADYLHVGAFTDLDSSTGQAEQ